MNGDRVKYIISRVPFDKSFIVDAQGHASGLWCLQDSAKWSLEVLEYSNHFFHFKVTQGVVSWLWTIVYVSPHSQFKVHLWRDLRGIVDHVTYTRA